MILENKKIK